jgi:hydroxymethylpyrimidine/phosphomethylpyrimidine kinase
MAAVALSIAGSDPSGGAGIQADLKTFHQFGVYGEAVITLITVQNTHALSRVEPLKADLDIAQIQAVVSDIPPQAAKTGALGTPEIVERVAELARTFSFPLVVDPVMISKQGARLISPRAEQLLKSKLMPSAFLLTPNLPEAEALSGMKIYTEADAIAAAERLRDFGCKHVLVKGGHRAGEPADLLCGPGLLDVFSGTRVESRHTHGTGCTYSAAITAGLALGLELCTAIQGAKSFIQAAIENAPNLGHGFGPVNHSASTVPV